MVAVVALHWLLVGREGKHPISQQPATTTIPVMLAHILSRQKPKPLVSLVLSVLFTIVLAFDT